MGVALKHPMGVALKRPMGVALKRPVDVGLKRPVDAGLKRPVDAGLGSIDDHKTPRNREQSAFREPVAAVWVCRDGSP